MIPLASEIIFLHKTGFIQSSLPKLKVIHHHLQHFGCVWDTLNSAKSDRLKLGHNLSLPVRLFGCRAQADWSGPGGAGCAAGRAAVCNGADEDRCCGRPASAGGGCAGEAAAFDDLVGDSGADIADSN